MFRYLESFVKSGEYERTVRDINAFVRVLYFMLQAVGGAISCEVRVPVQPPETGFERILEGRQIFSGCVVLRFSHRFRLGWGATANRLLARS
jgi:hypothetical protein